MQAGKITCDVARQDATHTRSFGGSCNALKGYFAQAGSGEDARGRGGSFSVMEMHRGGWPIYGGETGTVSPKTWGALLLRGNGSFFLAHSDLTEFSPFKIIKSQSGPEIPLGHEKRGKRRTSIFPT